MNVALNGTTDTSKSNHTTPERQEYPLGAAHRPQRRHAALVNKCFQFSQKARALVRLACGLHARYGEPDGVGDEHVAAARKARHDEGLWHCHLRPALPFQHDRVPLQQCQQVNDGNVWQKRRESARNRSNS